MDSDNTEPRRSSTDSLTTEIERLRNDVHRLQQEKAAAEERTRSVQRQATMRDRERERRLSDAETDNAELRGVVRKLRDWVADLIEERDEAEAAAEAMADAAIEVDGDAGGRAAEETPAAAKTPSEARPEGQGEGRQPTQTPKAGETESDEAAKAHGDALAAPWENDSGTVFSI